MQDFFEIGQIVNTSGLKGVVKVNPFTDDLTRFEELKTLFIEKNKELIEYEIEEVRFNKNQVFIKFKSIDSIEEAEKFRNCYLKISRKDTRKLPEDTYFIADLIGLNVYLESGELLGVLTEIFPTGSNDVYVIKTESGKDILLPAIKDVIKKINIDDKKIVVNLIEGLV